MTPLSLLDSPLLGAGLASVEARALFGPDAYLRRCIDVEVALARVQARLGLIPQTSADGIEDAARTCVLDLERLGREAELVGYPILPLVEQLAQEAGEAGRHLHWGATTQDILDTATVLQVRDGLALVERQIDAVTDALRRLAREHRDTPMAGRTHLQHALPVTFGYKAAVWLSPLLDHRERISQVRPRVLVVQFSGAAGTLASLGNDGLAVQAELAQELGLATPRITWHASRDGLAEVVQVLGLAAR